MTAARRCGHCVRRLDQGPPSLPLPSPECSPRPQHARAFRNACDQLTYLDFFEAAVTDAAPIAPTRSLPTKLRSDTKFVAGLRASVLTASAEDGCEPRDGRPAHAQAPAALRLTQLGLCEALGPRSSDCPFRGQSNALWRPPGQGPTRSLLHTAWSGFSGPYSEHPRNAEPRTPQCEILKVHLRTRRDEPTYRPRQLTPERGTDTKAHIQHDGGALVAVSQWPLNVVGSRT